MAAFNLTAEINLRGPSNLNRVVSNIRRQLSTVSLNLNINPNATRGIQTATSNVQALNAALQNANASASTLSATLRGLGSSLGTAAGGTNSLNNGLNNIAQQVTRTQRNTQQAALTMEDFGRQSALAVRRFAAFSVSAGAIYGLTRAISSAYGEFINFNKELVRLQQVTGTTANGLKGITDEITRLSTGLGVASADLLTVSSTLAQAGLSATETKTALEALAKSSLAPSFDNLNDTVEGSIALMRQFGISANDLESSLGSVNAVAAAFAVESGDIIKAIQRTGGVFAAASKGVSQGKDALNEFIAVFTSVRQTTRESAETIATGLRTIFTRVQRGATIEALKEYGIVLTDLEGKFVGPYEAIRRLSEGLKSLDPRDLRFNQIVEELGGFRQIGKVIPLIQQFTVAQQALGVAQKGSGSLAEAAGIAQLSLANKITKVREEFITLIRDIGQSKSFQTFADVSLKLASALISVASSAKEVLPALTALAAIRAIPAIGQFVGGFGRGFTRRNQGGPIRAFATGGYVPGSGNRDTVPAMLTPGEFVIRKKAVEKIGVGRLATLNRNGGGPVPTQYFANGGEVQRFMAGKFVMPKGRGKKGAKGARGPTGFQPLNETEYKRWAEPIYRRYDNDPTLPWKSYMGIPMPKEIADYAIKVRKYSLESGGAGLALGKNEKGIEVIAKFGRAKATEKRARKVSARTLRSFAKAGSEAVDTDAVNAAVESMTAKDIQKTLGSSMKRAPAGRYLEIEKEYNKDPEFRKLMGLETGVSGNFLKQFEAQAKQKVFTSPKPLIDKIPGAKARLKSFRAELTQELSRLSGLEQTKEIQKEIKTIRDQIKKSTTAIDDFDDYASGKSPSVTGRASHFAWAMRQAIPESSIFASGGVVQKFGKGKGVKKLSPGLEKQVAAAGGFENLLTKNMLDSSGVYNFGLVSLKSGTSKGSRIENRPIGKTGKRARIHVGTLSDRSKYDDIETNIVSSLQGVITQTGTALSSSLGSSIIGGKQGQRILNGAVLSSATGSIFEAALQMVGAPYIDKIESLKSIDFPFGLGKASSLFGSIPPNVPTDATRTIGGTGKGISDFVGQISRFLGAVDKKEFTKQLGTAAPDIFRALSQGGFSTKKAQKLNSLLKDAGVKVSVGSKPLRVAGKSQLEKGLPGVSPELRQRILDEIAAPYAKGGSIQDTVPALLTPGEFVINKKAAKRIGSAKLNKLNKADKIQGFNKGGSVGSIQSFASGGGVQQFAVGGIVSAMTSLVKSLPRLASAVANSVDRMRGIPRNIPQGGGWTTARGRAAPLPGRGGEGGGMSSMGLALTFIGPMIAESINSSITKNFGKSGAVAGSAISSTISGAAIGSALPFLGPYGALIGAAVGLTAGLLDAKSAANEYTKAQNEAKIETKSSSVEKSLEKLASGADFTADQFTSLGSNLNQLVALVRDNINIASEEAGGGRLGKITRGAKRSLLANVSDAILGTNFLGAPALDIDNLGREILASSQPAIGNVQRALAAGLQRGINLEELNKKTGGLASKRLDTDAARAKGLTELDRILAMMEDGASIAREEAQLEEARIRAREGGDPLDIKAVQGLEQSLAERYKLGSDAQKELMNTSQKTSIAIKAVVSQMELFAESSKNLSAIISRANAEFEESSRVRDIITGPGLGEARIAGPSRLNENVLSNMRAYSQQEVLSTIDTLSKNLGLDPEFTAQAKTSAVAQQTFERDLPKILLEAAQKQATAQFDEGTVRDEIRSVFKPIRELLKDEINTTQLDETINIISERLQKEAGSLQGKSYEEIVGSVPEFSQILEPLSKPVGVFQEGAKSFNDVIANTNNALNQYSSHIARIIDLQNQAASIQLEGANSLRQTLGEYVLPGDLNKPFENTIDRLTSTRGPNGLIVPGTGTLDPDEIARRLAQANKELTNLNLQQRPADPKKAEEFADKLVKAKTAVDRLSLAQQKLATDTTRASNALNRIRDLVQVREARRGGAEEILKNINNPEFMMDFVRDFGSFERVRGGQGTMMDIPAAVEMFNRRLQMIDPAKREDETRRFYQRIEEVMTRDVRRGGGGADPAAVKEFLDTFINRPDQDNQIKSAIDEYNAAIKTQSTATENMAKMMTDSSEIFYNKVIQAGIDFYNMVSGMRVGGFGVDNNPIGQAQMASTGGLIYANKGRLINFQPKGSDTVPAMLTPGEFVVNAKATKKNMGLLKAINGGKNKAFSRGGMVYLQGGGLISPEMRAILQDLYESPEIVTSSQDLGRTLSEVLETDGEAGLYNELKKHRGQPYGASADQSDLLYDFITKYETKQRETEKEKFDLKQNKELETMAKDFGYDNAKQMKEAQAEFNKQQIQDFLAAQELSFQDSDPSNNINIAQDRLSELRSGNVAQLTALEQDMFRKFKTDQQSKENQRKIQEEYNRNMEIVQAAQSQMNARKQLDDMAKKEINPYTGKPFVDAAEKEGVIARQAFDARQKAIADAKAQERLQKKEEVNAGLETFIPKLLTQYQSSKYYTQTSDPFLRELVETDLTAKSPKILAQYLELQKLLASKSGENLRNDPNFESRWFDARLEEVVSSAKLDYQTKGRRRQEDIARSQQEFANKNMEIALQQFGEGVDKSPILAAVAAVPRNVPNVLRTVVGGAGVLAGGVTYAAGSLAGEDNFVTQFGKSLMESGGAQAGIGVEGILQTGAGLGSRLGFGEAYDTAEKQAASRREALIAGEANKARGAYTTDPTTTVGQLLTPENVVRGSIATSDIVGEAAGDFVGVGGTLNRLSAKVLAGGAKQAGKRSLSLGQRLARTNADMAKPRIMSPQDIADAKAAEAIMIGRNIPAGGGWTGGTPLSRLTQGGVKNSAVSSLLSRPTINVIRSIGRGVLKGSDLAETGLMTARNLTTRAVMGGVKSIGTVSGGISKMSGKGIAGTMQGFVRSLGSSGKDLLQNFPGVETIGNMIRNRSTMKWFEGLKKQSSLPKDNPLANLIRAGRAKQTKAVGQAITPLRIRDIALSDTAKKYIESIPQSQKDAFEALSKNVNPEKQGIFLRDILEKAAADELKWLENPADFSGHLDKVANKYSQYYRQRGLPDTSDAIKKARGIFSRANPLINTTNPVIGVGPGAGLSTGVHESTHFAADMVGKLHMKYGELKDIVGSDLLESFLDTDYNDIVKSLNSAYNSKFVRDQKSVTAGAEFFTTLNQAASDPKTKDIFAKSTKAQEILKKLWEAHGYNKGGKVVYASKGKLVPYQPKGTDTVPAMLTPGEFVVNAKATKKNLGLLKAINGGAKGYSKGGVAYLEGGGRVRTRKDLEEEIEAKRKEREEIESNAKEKGKEYANSIFHSTPGQEGEGHKDYLKQLELFREYAFQELIGFLSFLPGGPEHESLNANLNEFRQQMGERYAQMEVDEVWKPLLGPGTNAMEGSLYHTLTTVDQKSIDNQLKWIDQVINDFKSGKWHASAVAPDTLERQRIAFDDMLAQRKLIETRRSGYTADSRQNLFKLGYEIKDSQNLLNDIDLLQDKPNAQNEARINYTSAKITLEDMGIDTTYFGGGFTTDEINKGLESPDFEAKAAQNKARAIQQLKERAEENLIANNIDWKEAKKEDPEVKAKNEAQAQQAEQKDKSQEAAKPTLSDAAKIALDSIRVNSDALLNATVADEAVRARNNIDTGLNDLSREGFVVDSSAISDILNAAQEQILEARNNQSGALQNFYDNNVLPVLGDLANQVGAQPPQQGGQPQQPLIGPPLPPVPPTKDELADAASFVAGLGQLRLPVSGAEAPEEDPYAGMNQRQRMLAMRKAEYEASQKAKREAFRTRTGRDPKTGRIGGPKVELTPEEKALNRKRAERLALAAIHPSERTEDQRERYQTLKDEWLAGLSPEQNANRDRAERIALSTMRPENRSAEQQERLDILKTPIDQRSPEQISRLEELRKEKEQALYASKGRLINFQPRGSDTVPAMLTPGEFVVNKRATKNNLGLLKQINSERFNNGGLVQGPQYLAEGGQLKASSGSSGNGVLSIDTTSLDSALSPFNASVSSFSSAIGQFENAVNTVAGAFNGLNNVVSAFTALSAVSSLLSGTATGLGSAIGTFNTAVGQLSTVLGAIPTNISLNVSGSVPVDINVTVNGGEGLGEKLDTFKDQIYNDISAAISEATSGKLRINLNTSKR